MLRLTVPAGLRFRIEKPIAAEIRVVRGVLLTDSGCGEPSLRCRLDHDATPTGSCSEDPRHVTQCADV